jgi:putative transposase
VTELKSADALTQHCLGPPALGPPASSPASSVDVGAPHQGWRSRGYLPHCDESSLVQHIVFGLADAIPTGAVLPSAIHGDRALDEGNGECLLRADDCASIVQRALLRADGERYRLIAWCVMPNHVHAIVEQAVGIQLSDIVQAWKSTSAHLINHHLRRRGRLWRREYFDRFMRDDDHLAGAIAYVENNPVKARFVSEAAQWKWSSAARRQAPHAGEDAGGPR